MKAKCRRPPRNLVPSSNPSEDVTTLVTCKGNPQRSPWFQAPSPSLQLEMQQDCTLAPPRPPPRHSMLAPAPCPSPSPCPHPRPFDTHTFGLPRETDGLLNVLALALAPSTLTPSPSPQGPKRNASGLLNIQGLPSISPCPSPSGPQTPPNSESTSTRQRLSLATRPSSPCRSLPPFGLRHRTTILCDVLADMRRDGCAF